MKYQKPGLAPANNPYSDFTAVDVQSTYADFLDRYEYWDMVLRSLPSPQTREEAQVEKARVEAIIKRMCASQ